ncbi:MAG: 2,3-bisphosphoglycerate-independent phosphoglycerate mutase [Flavobacteriaceae bacterium]
MAQNVLLMILDGWGKSPDPKVSAVDQAKTPYIDSLYKEYHHAELRTDGQHVGLPEGQMGNSEVGHMNLGAGRIVYQDLAKISRAIDRQEIAQEPELKEAMAYALTHQKPIHLMGLLSDGGVHSHIEHLEGLMDVLGTHKIPFYLHAFTDGRDVDPKSGVDFVERILTKLSATGGQLASIIGRYYAMDRDQRWERVKKAYDVIVKGVGTPTQDPITAIKQSYQNGITDEFLEPLVLTDSHQNPVGTLKTDDVVLFFNFRTDRGRQLTQALSQQAYPEQGMQPLSLYYVTLTNYDATFQNVRVIFDKENIKDTLGETLSKAGKSQVRIAETEKYPHVTFFFNGGREAPFEGEERILCPSPKVATYDLKPEMSAYEIRDAIVDKISRDQPNFICLNFANPDMVGHTGSMEAAIKACEVVDSCTQKVVETALKYEYACLIIADHGNCETMVNPDGTPNTAHTTNPVPVILVDQEHKPIEDGILGDIAPTILKLMGLQQPAAMTQKPLI